METRFLAHFPEEKQSELTEHLLTVANRTKALCTDWDKDIQAAAYYAGLLHDIGKLNPFYQELFHTPPAQRGSERDKKLEEKYYRAHAYYGTLMAYRLLNNRPTTWPGRAYPASVSMALCAISGHHTKLKPLEKAKKSYKKQGPYGKKFLETLKQAVAALPEFEKEAAVEKPFQVLDWETCKTRVTKNDPPFSEKPEPEKNPLFQFLSYHYVFGSLIHADRGSFHNIADNHFNLPLQTGRLVKDSALGGTRTEFQKAVLHDNEFSQPLMLLEAPTGIGKTKLFLDITHHICRKKKVSRVIYFSPLLALTEDFEAKLKKTLPEPGGGANPLENILVYNHAVRATLSDKESEREGESRKGITASEALFRRESFSYDMVITTTQRLLLTMFGTSAGKKMKLPALRNALLIVDEIQTIPKFLLPSFLELLSHLCKTLNSQVLLVSATVPEQVKQADVVRLNTPEKTAQRYLAETRKNIACHRKLNLPEALAEAGKGKLLVMANTRKRAKAYFDQLSAVYPDMQYLSSGIRKSDRSDAIKKIAQASACRVISTQVLEAGVDVSFTHMFRETAPLDNIIQALGRLNRENEQATPPTLQVFAPPQKDSPWRPYSELEYTESEKILAIVKNSIDLHRALPEYYRCVSSQNQAEKKDEEELADYIKNLKFDKAEEFVMKRAFLDAGGPAVLIPPEDEHASIQSTLLAEKALGKKLIDFAHFARHRATLPAHPERLGIAGYFVPDLAEKGIWLAKKEHLSDVYDSKVGLDKWLK